MRKRTHLQEEILKLLATHHFLSAPRLLELLHSQGLKVNKTSVYRSLDSFLEKGEVCRQSFGSDEFLYELRHDHHDHIQCEECGKVEETACLVAPPSEMKGFEISHHHLTLYGRCVDCQAQK